MRRLLPRPLFLAILVLLALPKLSLSANAETPDGTDWIADKTSALTRAVTLPDSTLPEMMNRQCITIAASSGGVDCVNYTSIGLLGQAGLETEGGPSYLLVGDDGNIGFQAVPGGAQMLKMYSAGSSGSYIGFYYSLQRSDLVKEQISHITYVETRYRITRSPDYFLTYHSCVAAVCQDKRLPINTKIMAFSKNGHWMVAETPQGLARINMGNFNILPFAPRQEAEWYSGFASAQIAISNDGRYVANSLTFNGGNQLANLSVYDLSTCDGSYEGFLEGHKTYCQHHDVWNGYNYLSALMKDAGVHGNVDGAIALGNLRFVDDGNISFNATYDKQGTQYKAATFIITAPGAQLHKIGLLGMGDSYISGEGEFQYIKNTNTPPNKCHQSDKSYPFLLGALYFDSYDSVACSGATSDDITDAAEAYKPQAKNNLNLDNNVVLHTFMPGYIPQNQFTQKYLPEAILLSIGGNNDGVDFSTILKACVIGHAHDGSCYGDHTSRYALLQGVYNQYDMLRKTFALIRHGSPGTRLYVVGYPQVAKPDGDCGVNVHLNQVETEFAYRLIGRLDDTIKLAAQAEGVFYVDTQHAFDGFRLCEANGAANAVNGLTAGNDSAFFIGKESYHPTVFGHQLLESVVAEQTQNLQAPMPAPVPTATKPQIDPDDPFLSDFTSQPQDEFNAKNDPAMAPDIILRGTDANINVNGLSDDTQLNGSYEAVLHSDPIHLGTVNTDANGDMNTLLHIPSNVPVGLHTLHLYGKDFSGQDIDIQKQVYVAFSANDYDGDGIPNSEELCGLVDPSGQDTDGDGIDDACDPVIGPPVPNTNGSSSETGRVLSAVTSRQAEETGTSSVGLQQAGGQDLQAMKQTDAALQLQKAPPIDSGFIGAQAEPKQTRKGSYWPKLLVVLAVAPIPAMLFRKSRHKN